MEKGLDVNINAELKADLQPVIESTPSALNKLFELLFGIKHAERKRVIELINAQRNKDAAAIQDGFAIFNVEDKSIAPIVSDGSTNGGSLIANTIQHDEVSNISNCAKHAAINLLDVELTEEKEITKDFFNRWRNEAKLISDESAQIVWGLILSEEIQHPDSIGFRTLDVLKNLTKSEAKLFDEMGEYVLYGSVLLTGEHIDESQLRKLADAGLVNFAGIYRNSSWESTKLTIDSKPPIHVPYVRWSNYFIHSDPSEEDFKFSYMPLTDAGISIYKICAKNNAWEISKPAKCLLQNKTTPDKITCYKFTDIEANRIDTNDPKIFLKSDFEE